MPRLNRCLLFLYAMAVTGSFLSFTVPTFAQSKPHKSLPQPTGRLAARMRLGDGRQTWHPTRKQLGVAYAPGGSESSALGMFKFVVNRAKLRAYLNGIAPYIRRAPKNARPIIEHASSDDMGEGQVAAEISPGYDGAVLDIDAAVDQVQKAIEADPSVVHIILPIKSKPAKVSAEALKGIDARIGYFITRFNPGDEGRTATVRRAINIIDGTIVPPSAVFSVDKTVGPRDPAHGFFGKGHVFINGHMELQSGGGMCQVATTLFNASMLTNLKIVERHQHVRTVPYVDPGRDATIYHGQKDFRIQNDTSAPIYISYKTSHSHAIVSIFGKGTSGLKVRLVSRYRHLGERHYTGTFYRVISEPGSAPRKDSPFQSNYKWTPDLDYSH